MQFFHHSRNWNVEFSSISPCLQLSCAHLSRSGTQGFKAGQAANSQLQTASFQSTPPAHRVNITKMSHQLIIEGLNEEIEFYLSQNSFLRDDLARHSAMEDELRRIRRQYDQDTNDLDESRRSTIINEIAVCGSIALLMLI